MARSNNAPKTKWTRIPLACGTIRHRLFVDDKETPFFVDDAKAAGIGHRTMGEPVGLFGSGMGKEIEARSGIYRIAATLGSYHNVGIAKARAEQMALSA